MIRALVFDFGNVVGFFDHRLTSRRLLSHSSLPAEQLHAAIFGTDLEEEYESGRLSSAEFLERVRIDGKLCCSQDSILAAYSQIFWPNDEICALLPELRPNYRLVLGSNTSELHSRQFRRQFTKVLKLFAAQVLSHEIGVRKPNRGFFEECQRQAGCAVEQCVFIDDLAVNVAGARACGWRGILYTGAGALRRELAELGVVLSPQSARLPKSFETPDAAALNCLEETDGPAQER